MTELKRLTETMFLKTVEWDDMRTAYDKGRDDQLEQVIDWLHNNLDENYIWADVFPPGIDVESVIDDLKQEMRPTKTQEDD